MSSDSEEVIPLAQRAVAAREVEGSKRNTTSGQPKHKPASGQSQLTSAESSGDGDSMKLDSSSGDSEDDVPLSQRLPPSQLKSKPAQKRTRAKAESKAVVVKRPRKSDVPAKEDRSIKWKTLQHNGIVFPPDYKPHGIKVKYKGVPVELTPEQEEVATLWAAMIDTDYAKKEMFINNFWEDFQQVLGKKHTIQSLQDCDFQDIYDHLQVDKEKKKNMDKEEKVRIKNEKDEFEKPFKTAMIDGQAEPMGNFRVEPPGLFRGRGDHPKMGKLKKRIYPRDITINIGKGEKIPEHPYPGQKWKEVRHDQTVTWMAFWRDPINTKQFKYIWLAANSTFKTESDLAKYEKARLLHEKIDKVRAEYRKWWKDSDPRVCQMGVALYFLDRLALRAGHEKDDDEADTVGCCTLKVRDVHLHPPHEIEFDFLGKDSIRYTNKVEVDKDVFKAMVEFKHKTKDGGKKGGEDQLFDAINAQDLNAKMKDYMDGLSVKVFRTYNASVTLNRLLFKDCTGGEAVGAEGAATQGSEDADAEVAKKVISVSPVENEVTKKAFYDVANKQVAILCNHQRAIPKTHEASMAKMDEEIIKTKAQIAELEQKLKAAKAGKPVDGKNVSVDVLIKRIAAAQERLSKQLTRKDNREELKNVALGTSKINYLDPRITVAWCKRLEMPIEKIFNKSLLGKFAWAMSVEPDFKFVNL